MGWWVTKGRWYEAVNIENNAFLFLTSFLSPFYPQLPQNPTVNCLILLNFLADSWFGVCSAFCENTQLHEKQMMLGKILDWSCWYLWVKSLRNNSQTVCMCLRSNIWSLLCTCWKSHWVLALPCMVEHAQFFQCHVHTLWCIYFV